MRIVEIVSRLVKLRPIATMFGNLRLPLTVLIYRRGRLRVAGHLAGAGRLTVGKYWPGQVPRTAEVVVRKGGECVVEGNFVIHRGTEIRVRPGAKLSLGSGYFADDVRIDCQREITIGHRVAIAAGTIIIDTDHHDLSGSRGRTASVAIGDDVWIGLGAKVLKGVTIGNGAVIAAGSIVTRDVAPGMLVAGSPAKAVRPVTWTL